MVLLAFSACQQDQTQLEEFDQKITRIYPDRPDLQPGEFTEMTKLKSASITSDLTSMTPEQLVGYLIAPGPDAPIVSNVAFTGALNAAGTFSDDTDVFGFTSGIVLSSGSIGFIEGPNSSSGASANNGLTGDDDLTALIPGYTTYDATVLEFDFECQYLQYISFQYVFASEEYNEYVGSSFNDVFGFFVNGVNIAVIPETTTPVSVNNLNCGKPYGTGDAYCSLFKNNDLFDGGAIYDTEADGFTVVMTATTAIKPGVNHIKLAIADAGDHILDSHVLIKAESFVCAPPILPVVIDIKPDGVPNAVNCDNPNSLITVAILSTTEFDATMVNHETVTFQGAAEHHFSKATGLMMRHVEDVDLDGDLDLVFHFLLSETDLDCLSTEGRLIGELYNGTPIEGVDELMMVNTPQ